MSAEYDRPDEKTKIIRLRSSFAENFYRFLKKEDGLPYSIKKVQFEVKDEKIEPDGTKYITIHPVKTEDVADIKADGFYLISSDNKPQAYLLEFSSPNRWGDSEYFLGINSVPNPKLIENKSEWAKEVLKNKISYVFQNQPFMILGSIGIWQNGSEDITARLYGFDQNLIYFFESLR